MASFIRPGGPAYLPKVAALPTGPGLGPARRPQGLFWYETFDTDPLSYAFPQQVGSTASRSGINPRNGHQSVLITKTGAASASIRNLDPRVRTTAVFRFWFFTPSANPSASMTLFQIQAPTNIVCNMSTAGAINAGFTAATTSSGTGQALSTWHSIDMKIDLRGPTWTVDWALDGTPLAQSTIASSGGGSMSQWAFDKVGAITTTYQVGEVQVSDALVDYRLPDLAPLVSPTVSPPVATATASAGGVPTLTPSTSIASAASIGGIYVAASYPGEGNQPYPAATGTTVLPPAATAAASAVVPVPQLRLVPAAATAAASSLVPVPQLRLSPGAAAASASSPAPVPQLQVLPAAAAASASSPVSVPQLQVLPAAATASAAALVPTVTVAAFVSAPVATASASSPAPVPQLQLSPPSATSAASALVPAVTAGLIAFPPAATASAAAPSPSIAVQVVAAVATAAASAPLPVIQLRIALPVATAAASAPIPTLTAAIFLFPPAASASASGPGPVVKVALTAPVGQAVASAIAPVVLSGPLFVITTHLTGYPTSGGDTGNVKAGLTGLVRV